MMEEDKVKLEGFENIDRDKIFSKAIRAGKRTYFFDVKATKRNDYYVTITESKKRFQRDGRYFYEKHKIFLYKEDFEKFVDGLNEAVQYANEAEPLEFKEDVKEEKNDTQDYTNVEFDDLEKIETSSAERNEE
jgi:hypothetical protein